MSNLPFNWCVSVLVPALYPTQLPHFSAERKWNWGSSSLVALLDGLSPALASPNHEGVYVFSVCAFWCCAIHKSTLTICWRRVAPSTKKLEYLRPSCSCKVGIFAPPLCLTASCPKEKILSYFPHISFKFIHFIILSCCSCSLVVVTFWTSYWNKTVPWK